VACTGDKTPGTTDLISVTSSLASISSSFTGAVTSQMDEALCLDVTGRSTHSGTPAIVWTCDGATSQRWTLTPAGELRTRDGGMCLDASTDAGGQGDPLILRPCVGSATQKWEATSAGQLRSSDGHCADVWGGRPRSGAEVVLYYCHGGRNQSWNFPEGDGDVGVPPTDSLPDDSTAVDPPPNDSTPTDQPTPTEPLIGAPLYPGESIQAAVNAAPAGATFLIKAGPHLNQSVVPKAGNVFLGEPGAILDGGGTTPYAFSGGSTRPSNVRIEGLVIQNYNPAVQMGPIKAGGHTGAEGTSGWIVKNNEVRYNKTGGGIRIGHRMQVLGNHVHHNAQIGIVGVGDSVLVEGNEIAFNNYLKQYDYNWEAGGTKFVLTKDLVVRNNYSHDNWGTGLWTDIDNVGALIEGNRVFNNADVGIYHEISGAAVIRNNEIRGNGFDRGGIWLWGAGIVISASSDVEVYGNTLSGNAHGIAGVQQARGSGIYGTYLLRNIYVHDNDIDLSAGGKTGAVQDIGDNSMFTTANIRFAANRYTLGANAYPFAWANADRSVTQWKGYGQDLTGTFSP
jgi:parallel beta-helix repeat protein